VHHELGFGTARDISKAWQWVERAALSGHVDAMSQMGFYCSQGIRVASRNFLTICLRNFLTAAGFVDTIPQSSRPISSLIVCIVLADAV
jgi:TPR repeat protein